MLEERFWSKVNKTNGCWLWTACKDKNGYGYIYLTGAHVDPKYAMVHRLSWELHNGPIPDNMMVCHECDNPSCIRPDHLFLGDYKANLLDATAKQRTYNGKKTHCKHGHEFNEENTYFSRLRNGRMTRVCKICRRKIDKARSQNVK